METDLDRVRSELSEIHERLLALTVDANDERSKLKDRQNEHEDVEAPIKQILEQMRSSR